MYKINYFTFISTYMTSATHPHWFLPIPPFFPFQFSFSSFPPEVPFLSMPPLPYFPMLYVSHLHHSTSKLRETCADGRLTESGVPTVYEKWTFYLVMGYPKQNLDFAKHRHRYHRCIEMKTSIFSIFSRKIDVFNISPEKSIIFSIIIIIAM